LIGREDTVQPRGGGGAKRQGINAVSLNGDNQAEIKHGGAGYAGGGENIYWGNHPMGAPSPPPSRLPGPPILDPPGRGDWAGGRFSAVARGGGGKARALDRDID